MEDGINTAIYGSSQGTITGEPLPPVNINPAPLEPQARPQVMVGAEAAASGTIDEGIGKQAAVAGALWQPPPTQLESAGAALAFGDTATIYRYFSKKNYAAEPGYDKVAGVNSVPFITTESETEALMGVNSTEERLDLVERIKERRQASEVSGENFLGSMIGVIADPTTAATALLGGFAAKAAVSAFKVGRVGAASVGAGVEVGSAGAVGYMNKELYGISDIELTLNLVAAAASGVASGVVMTKPGKNFELPTQEYKLVPADPTYPSKALDEVAERIRQTVPEADVKGVRAESDAVSAATLRRREQAEALAEMIDDGVARTSVKADALTTLPKELAGAKPRYSYGAKQFDLDFTSDFDRAAYITAQSSPSKRDADYLKFAMESQGMTEAEVRAHGRSVRTTIKEQAKDAEPGALQIPAVPKANFQNTTAKTFAPKLGDAPPSRPMVGGVRMTAREVLETIADYPLTKGVGEFGALAKELLRLGGKSLDDLPVKQIDAPDTARAVYNPNTHQILTDLRDLSKRNSAQAAVHEISHGLTVQKIYYGLENPNTAIGALVRELDDLRKLVRVESRRQGVFPVKSQERYLTKDPMEFAAGLFWGRGEFTGFLSKIKLGGEVNALSSMVNTVRKLLGLTRDKESVLTRALDIKEQLIATPLNVVLPNGKKLSFAPDPSGNVAAQIIKNEEDLAKRLGHNISISLHKTMGSFGPKSKEVSDLLFDDPINMTGDSVASQTRAISADLSAKKYAAEDLFAEVLAERGAGIRQRIGNSADAAKVQQALEHDVSLLMAERYRLGTKAKNEDPKMAALADALDEAYKAGLLEQKAAGVRGSEAVEPKMGYFPRKMDATRQDEMLTKLRDSGMTPKKAQSALDHMVARGIARMNPAMTAEVAQDVAHAILARARAKGYFEDVVFRRHVGNEAAKEMREILTGSGIRGDRLDRAMAALEGAVDEAGKSSSMKHRVDMDLRYGMNIPGTGEQIRIVDLLDTSVLRLTEGYLDKAAANSAFARKGLADATSIDKLRTDLSHSIANEAERKRAMYLFDNGVAMLKGDPVGEDMHIMMRNMQAITQMVGLGSSGLWQLTEVAPIMAQYGAVKTMKEMVRTMPLLGSLMGDIWKDKGLATHLSNVLTRNATQDVRIRPYITKLEDNFEMPIGDSVGMSLLQAKQLVPYINGMKYIQKWQAGMVGNLITDLFERAAKGDKSALKSLEKVGLESQTMDGIRADIISNGLDTAKWSDATWAAVRGPLNKMVDDSILRARVGEIPAFAQFSQVGKFVFTFKNFVLTAHNKILAGTLGREGFAGLGLLMAYQYPLTLMATAVNTSLSGKSEQKSFEDLAAMSLSQMGAMGLLSEFAGVISGNKQQFGAPGLIAIDRMYKTVGAVGTELRTGEGSPMAALLQVLPIISIIPGTKALSETLKD